MAVVREAERNAFAKAWAYLNYSPGAKWSALAAGVANGVLNVALLCVLWLFADLVIYRGQIPIDPVELPERDQQHFAAEWSALPDAEKKQLLKDVGADEALAATDPLPDTTSSHDREIIWRAYLPHLLGEAVGPKAEELVKGPADRPLPDVGLLSLVVRTHLAGRWFTP